MQGIGWDLDDENKLQVDEKEQQNPKNLKFLKMYNITNFKTLCYELTASGNIIYSIPNYKLQAFGTGQLFTAT